MNIRGEERMGTDNGGSEHHDSAEIQGLMCGDILRDWLKHLEDSTDERRRSPVNGDQPDEDDSLLMKP